MNQRDTISRVILRVSRILHDVRVQQAAARTTASVATQSPWTTPSHRHRPHPLPGVVSDVPCSRAC